MTKEQWDSKIIENGGEFLQSWDWGEFQEVLGRKIIRFSSEVGMAQIIITQLPLNLCWAYIPRGPIFFDKEKSKDLISKIMGIVPKNAVFVDFEPAQDINIGFPKFKSRQPEHTLLLDLCKSEDELLDKMHSKTRYSIRLAEKRGLEFKELDNEMEFYKVLKLTSGRQKFRTYNELYFNLMKKNLDPANLKFFGVFNNGEIIASGLFYRFGETVIYLHGGSNYEHRALMAPYLLHWEAIKFFKKSGIKYYDFWGVDEKKWPGVTRFKIRFGGEIKKYPGAYVKILKPFWFKVYQVARRR
jgi:lipid II:glycine glycyltransferase (peptidoglycan interpeptide bridge formation enzyme)